MDVRDGIPALGVFLLVAALGFDSGGYAATAWGWSAVAVLFVLAALIARGTPRPTTPALVLVAGLAALTAWAAASTIWSSDVSGSMLEAERLLLYVGAAGLFVLAPSMRGLAAGVLGATTVLCGTGLWRWLLGSPEVPLSADPRAAERLSDPIGYANGVGILAVIGMLVAVGIAARAERRSLAALAAAAVPIHAATLFFTYSRGAWLALAIGLLVGIAVGPARLQLAACAAALAPFVALTVALCSALDAGGALAALVLVLAAASAAAAAAFRSARVEVAPGIRTAFAVVLVGLPVAVAAGALVRLGGPAEALRSFKETPAPLHGDVSGRLLSASGSNRADYWSVAWRAYEQRPLVGEGAGTYARVWLARRPVPQPVRDAHSLYLETLAEVGPAGLLLLLIALAAPLTGSRTRWTAAALAPYSAFLAHTAQDWDWELPAVTVAALACGAALVVPPNGSRVPRLAAVVPALLAALALAAYAGNRTLAEATVAADRSNYAASADEARRARRLQPWSGEPYRLLGEAQLADGSDREAADTFRKGLEHDRSNWELWLDLGLATDGAERRDAWSHAASLNPLSPELKELGYDSR